MGFDPLKHHRRSIRLRGYDYARAGAYFVTVVVQDRMCLLGEVVEGVVRLSEAGQRVQTVWDEMPAHYAGVEVDWFVVMPNHVHGIVVLVEGEGEELSRPGQARGPAPTKEGNEVGAAPRGRPGGKDEGASGVRLSLPEVVQRFKTMTTTRYVQGVEQAGWPGFRKRVWQRNYFEKVIRSEARLSEVRRYIEENPLRWELDEENPNRVEKGR